MQMGDCTVNGGRIGSFYIANDNTKLTVNEASVDYIRCAGNKAMTLTIGTGSIIGKIEAGPNTTVYIEAGASVGTLITNSPYVYIDDEANVTECK